MNSKIITIPTSKLRIVFLLALSVLFVVGSVWVFLIAEEQTNYPPAMMKIIGVIGGAFFSLGIVAAVGLFFKKRAGLIIDDEGITDHLTNPCIGLIRWEDIVEAKVVKLYSTKMLLIVVTNPEKYLTGLDTFKYKGYHNNYKLVGTPFVIPSGILKWKLKDVEMLINKRLLLYTRY